jgi:hypothetical protein
MVSSIDNTSGEFVRGSGQAGEDLASAVPILGSTSGIPMPPFQNAADRPLCSPSLRKCRVGRTRVGRTEGLAMSMVRGLAWTVLD